MAANHHSHMSLDTLKSSILIEIRNAHTMQLAAEFVRGGVVSNEYLDKLLRIDMMNQLKPLPPSGFNESQRIEKLQQLLQKHSVASTASFIGNLSG